MKYHAFLVISSVRG